VPFTVRDGTMYFLLGVDKVFHCLTDLGGGIKRRERKRREGVLKGGMREFREESNSIFGAGYYSSELLYDQVAIVDASLQMAAVFLPVSSEWLDSAVNLFAEEAKKERTRACDEIESLVWVSEREFRGRIKTMWRPVKQFYGKGFTERLTVSLRYVFRQCLVS